MNLQIDYLNDLNDPLVLGLPLKLQTRPAQSMKQWSIVRLLITVLSPIAIARTLYCPRGCDNDNNRPYCSRGRLKSALQAALLPEECYDDFITAKSTSATELCPRVGTMSAFAFASASLLFAGRKTSRVQHGMLIASAQNSRSPAVADYNSSLDERWPCSSCICRKHL